MNASVEKFINKIDSFLFYQEDSLKASIFRICFGVVLLLNQALLRDDILVWFSEEGVLPLSAATKFTQSFTFSIFFYPYFQQHLELCYYFLVISTILYTAGIFPRIIGIIMLILTVSFHNRNSSLFHAGDMLIRLVLVLNLFIDSGKRLSLFSYFKAYSKQNNDIYKSISGWPFRVIQFQLCFVYFFAAISKMSSSQWISGEYIFEMLNFPGRGYFNFLWLREVPSLANLMTYYVLFAEFSFAFFVWFHRTRYIALLLVVLMHIGIEFTINTIYFSEVMFVLLFTFISISDVKSYVFRK